MVTFRANLSYWIKKISNLRPISILILKILQYKNEKKNVKLYGKGRLIINVSEHSSIFDRKLLPQISIFFPHSKSLLKYTLK
jgi:hypothetical protein